MLIKLLILAILSYNKYQKPLEIINPGINMQTPPIAKKIPYRFKIHGTEIEDEYHWLNAKGWPEKITDKDILAYLEEENGYFNNFMNPLAKQKDIIFPLQYKSPCLLFIPGCQMPMCKLLLPQKTL